MRFAFFDLDDTLLDTAGALRLWASDFVHEYGLGGEEAVDEAIRRRAHGVANWWEFAGNLREWYGIDADQRETYQRIVTEYPAKFTLDPAVAEGLERLRADGWRLGIVTNGQSRVQRAKIDNVGLAPYVDMVLDSETAGHDKPDVRIFELAAGKLGVGLGPEGWMVGDMLDKDIQGAIAAGLHSVWLPHGRPLPQEGPQPEHVVPTVVDAMGLIAASA